MKTFRLTLLPGDGIGPKVMDAALPVMSELGNRYDVECELNTELIGGSSYEEHGVPVTHDTLQVCKESDAVLLGAIGGPQWENLPHEKKPEAALLKLRDSLGLYSNLRPAKVYGALVEASPLKRRVVAGTDVMVVRELTGGIYFGSPRGMDEERGWNTLAYSRPEVERIARIAFELAHKRRNSVTSVHKANVLESSQFWKDVVHEVHRDYPEVSLNDMYVDNAAMQLVSDPGQFDVILTQNMFGDILSDITATISGSLGMLPSASVGDRHALYEPVHGSAPDIAGQNSANPIGMVNSVAMMFAYSFHMKEAAEELETAIEETLAAGYATADIASSNSNLVSTSEMGELIVKSLRQSDETSKTKTSMEQ